MRAIRTATYCSALIFAPGFGSAATFDLILDLTPAGVTVDDFSGNEVVSEAFTDRQIALLGAAENFWESVVTGFDGVVDAVHTISTAIAPEDGFGSVLAFAGPRTVEFVGSNPQNGENEFARPVTGVMQFDADDFGPRSEQDFLNVALHEIGHSLGFIGGVFNFNNLLDGDGNYVGDEGLAAFNDKNGTSVTSILLQEGSGHWDECYERSLQGLACSNQPGTANFFNDEELMTPFISNPVYLSEVTVAAMRDIGYITSNQTDFIIPLASEVPDLQPVPLPAGLPLLIGALAGIGVMRRRAA